MNNKQRRSASRRVSLTLGAFAGIAGAVLSMNAGCSQPTAEKSSTATAAGSSQTSATTASPVAPQPVSPEYEQKMKANPGVVPNAR